MLRTCLSGVQVFSSLVLASVLLVIPVRAQSVVTGTVADTTNGTLLAGVHVLATLVGPDSMRVGGITDSSGTFRLGLAASRYRLRFSYVGYVPAVRVLTVEEATILLVRIALTPDSLALGEVVIEGMQERVVLRGDTTVYNAAAFRVNPDASTEDLIAKMPGIIVQDGNVQAHGEDVKRVLVDGEDFFGNDPRVALRTLPADIVEQIEVYDRQSDQARFTGFDDGNAEKTINIVTRLRQGGGQFGRAFGSYGTDAHYLAGASMNVFDGARRISLLGLSNDVNQQNFSTEDLLGVLGDAAGRRGGGPRSGGGPPNRGGPPGGSYPGGGGRFSGGPPPGGGPGGLGADPSNYLIGEQGGINQTSSLGINYIDRWGKNVRVNGSYFFNTTGNDTETGLEREYFLTSSANQLYDETNDATSRDTNHRLNMRLDAQLSDATQLTITPRLSLQRNTSESVLGSYSALAVGTPLSQGANAYEAENQGYTSSTNLLIRHRFPTRGRTLSANVGLGLDGRWGDTAQDIETLFYDEDGFAIDSANAYNRTIDSDGWGRTLSVNVAYTEPLGSKGLLQLSYTPSLSSSTSDQNAFRLDETTGLYTLLDSAYTISSDQRVVMQRGGLSYQYRLGRRIRASAGLDVQNERLRYEQGVPRAFEVNRSYLLWLPSARVNADLSDTMNVGLSYRAHTTAPGVGQLREVIDDTNPLLITTGNPNLQTSTSQQIDVRLRAMRPSTSEVFFGFATFTTTRDYVGTALLVAETDTLVARGITLEPGAQLSYPVNLDGYWSARSFFTYGRPLGFLQSNANAGLGLTYSRTPSQINGVLNRANALQVDGRLFLGSNISERLDFSLRYTLSFTTVANASTTTNDGTYTQHRSGFDLNWLPWDGLVLGSHLDLSHYVGLSETLDPTSTLWSVGLGYKFLHEDVAEIRLTVNDLFNENRNIYRNVTNIYVEDRQTEALGRYVMLNLSYKLRHFNI